MLKEFKLMTLSRSYLYSYIGLQVGIETEVKIKMIKAVILY
jgi:hypothetical protein